MPTKPPERIGNYDIEGLIAEGSMGAVYKGHHRDNGTTVAIKVINPNLAKNPVMVKRFEQEFRAARILDHPNIVRGLEFGQDGNMPYLVMEYVDGENLGQFLDREGRLSEAEAIRIMIQVAKGLHQAHQQGIIHRDVKPDNILLNSQGQAKLSDLGLVKEVEAELNLTHTGRGLGTPYFMAPEQFRNAKHANVRCDIYSMGATLYMLVTGELPFKGCSPIDAYTRKARNEYKQPRDLVPELSERVNRAIVRAMSSDPAMRPVSCLEFVEDLGSGRSGRPARPADKAAPAASTKARTDKPAVPSPKKAEPVKPAAGEKAAPARPAAPQRASFSKSDASAKPASPPAESRSTVSNQLMSSKAIGNYEVISLVAEGGMGFVFKARHRDTGTIVAIKVAFPDKAENPIHLKRFEQEFRAANTLNHPNIVRGLEYGEADGLPYFVMEYVDGPSIGKYLHKKGRFTEADAIRIITQVAEGLHAAHQQGIIHRDVKPDNILLAADGRAKLTDLGLIKDTEAELNLTRTGRGLGTPHYMAPEQFRNAKHVDARGDIYSLAATLYSMITAKVPFQGYSTVDAFAKKVQNEFIQPREIVPTLSEHVNQAIVQAMSSDPNQRPSSIPDFVAELTGTAARKPRTREDPSTAPASAKEEAGKNLRVERRAMIRYPSKQKGSCRAIGGESKIRWVATINDISAGGVSLLLRRRFEPRTVLAIEVRAKNNNITHQLLVRVVRIQQHSRRQWIAGCSFARKLSEEEVQSLM